MLASMSPPEPPRRSGSGLKLAIEATAVSALARKARELDAIDRALRQTLASPLREQVRFAGLRAGRLVFLASSPAWASRLRLRQAQLIATAQAIGCATQALIVKVAPLPPPVQEKVVVKPLSAGSAAHLRAAAEGLKDQELRNLFLALAEVAGRQRDAG